MARIERLKAAEPLSALEACWLTGFLEAEGCFRVERNNSGRNWRCVLSVAVRDDDAPLLLELQERTRLGRVRPVAARGSSRPQACWVVDSKLELEVLSRLLSLHPPCGRKRREVAAWCAAVELLACRRRGCDSEMDTEIADLATLVTECKAYRSEPPPAVLHDDTTCALAYLGGLFTGEGHLSLNRPRLVIKMRADDRDLLKSLSNRYGIGAVYYAAGSDRSAPSSQWVVTARAELRQAAKLLEEAGLRGRKGRQFAAWKRGIAALGSSQSADLVALEVARAELRAATKYVAPPEATYTQRPYLEAREAYLAVLRAWAATVTGPLTCTAYSEARRAHPRWPTRGTLALDFGSWAEALEAAGLRHRAHARSAA